MEKAASLPTNKVFDELNTSENGLTSEEAKLPQEIRLQSAFREKANSIHKQVHT